jgi:hypothetical protein
VLAFLDLDRPLEYEWALKCLKLSRQSPSWRMAWSEGEADEVHRVQREHLARSGYAS